VSTIPLTADFRSLADELPIFVWMQAADGRIEWLNRAWYEFTGLTPEDATTASGWGLVGHPDDFPAVVAAFHDAVARGTVYEIEHRIKPAHASDADYRWILTRSTPLFDHAGNVSSWIGFGIDIHDARERAAERARLLASVAEADARSFETISNCVPQMMWSARADGWIDWYNERWFEFTGQTRDEASGWGWQAVHHPEDLPNVLKRWPESIANGQPFEMEFRLRRADGAFRMFLTRANPVHDGSGIVTHWYGTNTDIENDYQVRMRERRIAQTFQDAALQETLPAIPGLALDAIYEPGQSDAQVGGDWFDVFRLIDGRVVFSVGDVAGSGLNAAVTMGALRQSIRTAALINPDPIAVLDAVDRIVRDLGTHLFATAFVGVFDPIHAELRYASAGHPPPLVRRSDGLVFPLTNFNLPLGVRQRSYEQSPSMIVEPGMLLVMYTDGLTEYHRDALAGERRLTHLVAGLAKFDEPARAIYEGIVDGDGPHDDIAILCIGFSDALVRRDGAHGIWTWTFEATHAEAAYEVRSEVSRILRDSAMTASDLADAMLVYGELVGNVVRYAPGTIGVSLDATADYPVLHVLDEGTGFEYNRRLPHDTMSESGRGLFIVSHLAKELSITRRNSHGSHMRAVLAHTARRTRET